MEGAVPVAHADADTNARDDGGGDGDDVGFDDDTGEEADVAARSTGTRNNRKNRRGRKGGWDIRYDRKDDAMEGEKCRPGRRTYKVERR